MGGSEGGWEGEGGLNHPLAVKKSHCVLSKAQKQPQCTCQDKTVVGSSLTPHAALLVCPWHHTPRLSSALSLTCLDSARMWLSC